MCQELAQRLRNDHKAMSTVHLNVTYSKEIIKKGIHKQRSIKIATCSAKEMYKTVLAIFREEYEKDTPVRKLSISASKLIEFRGEQLSIFDSNMTNFVLDRTVDEIKTKFGKNAILNATSYVKAGTLKTRNKLIGGHNK